MTQHDREEFLVSMAREGVPLDVARRVLRAAVTLHRHAERACSSEAYDRDRVPCPVDPCRCDYDAATDTHQDVPRGAVTVARLETRVTALLAPYAVTPVYQGDPRGAVVKLQMPSGRTNDWGQTGLCVPS